MQFSGKLHSRQEEEELNSLPVFGLLIYLQDVLTNHQFLVDTGVSCSVFPHHSSAALTGPCLRMDDGRPMKSWGCKTLPLQFGNHPFQYPFLLASIDNPILGADFLAEFDLLVDPARCQVIERSSLKPLSPPLSSPADISVTSISKLAPDVSSF